MFQNLFALLDVWRSSFLLLPIVLVLFYLIDFSLYKVLICSLCLSKLNYDDPDLLYRLEYGKEDDDILWDSRRLYSGIKGKGVW